MNEDREVWETEGDLARWEAHLNSVTDVEEGLWSPLIKAKKMCKIIYQKEEMTYVRGFSERCNMSLRGKT